MDGYDQERFIFYFSYVFSLFAGNKSVELMAQGKKVLFAFEEAIGFMFSTAVLDKDGVSAACHLATMACYLKKHNQLTLTEKLNEIYDKYGFHCTNNSYLFCYDPKTIVKIFERLRNFTDTAKVKLFEFSIHRFNFIF